ncbi:RNA polymerase sigma factor [Paenibacillus terrigena]|uniref:RNA polymerase sigma factor n=2 Tax=Paenibacillus terrigena TaxID=369333 RepID=UPI00036D882E|nr:sigma-70 family RNA polymerase sigma factor [Paenibacillus terrigena]
MLPDELEQWADLYAQRLVRLAYTYARDYGHAEDRVQDAFLKAYTMQHQYRSERGTLFSWLAKIVINECRMAYRRSWREKVMEILPERATESTEEMYLSNVSAQLVYQAVLELPEFLRTPIVLHYYEDLSVEEIAFILAKPAGTVKSRLWRGRARLRHMLEEEYDEQSHSSIEKLS